MTGRRARLRVGTSGWQYDDWRGRFYPEDVPRRAWLRWYAGRFDTVEVNNTFYRLPAARTFDAWQAEVPAGFTFALKFSRYGSHMKRLRAPRGTLGRFLRRAERLRARLGPILVQLPPRWRADPGRLAAFLDAAPRGYRWAVELRDPSWLSDAVYRVLADHDAALCIHDLLAGHPRVVTTGWVYLRFHGRHYAGRYAPATLRAWARWIRARLAGGLDVYAYFNNDVGGAAVLDAADLRRYVGGRRAAQGAARRCSDCMWSASSSSRRRA